MNARPLLLAIANVAMGSLLAAESYTYDAAGRLTSVVYDDGSTLRYTYDPAGNIMRIATLQDAMDADLDGMEDSWEVRFFGSTAAADPDGDSDRDGLTELAEFALGRRPDVPDAADATIVSLGAEAGEEFLEFTYQRSKSAAVLVTFTVELSHNLLDWFSGPEHVEAVGSPIDLGDDLEQVRFRVVLPVTAEPDLYVRLLIERKP